MVAFLFQFHSRYLSSKAASAFFLLSVPAAHKTLLVGSPRFLDVSMVSCITLGVKKIPESKTLAKALTPLKNFLPDPHSLRSVFKCFADVPVSFFLKVKSEFSFYRTEAVTDREELPKVPSWKLTTFAERMLELICALPATMLEPCPQTKLSFEFYVMSTR